MGVLDVKGIELDAYTFAPYKAFGIMGCGYGCVSDRVATMKHHKLLAKRDERYSGTEAVAEYYKRGVTVYERINTSLYSKRIVESHGLTGCSRVSPLHCHDTGDIDDFLKVTAQITGK